MKPKIPKGCRELRPLEIIETDDKIWAWDVGPWIWVGGSLIGERYNRPSMSSARHWTIIRLNSLQNLLNTESLPSNQRAGDRLRQSSCFSETSTRTKPRRAAQP